MKKHSMSTGSDCSNGTFCMSILMMSTNPRERLGLLTLSEGVGPSLTSEDPIITMVGRDVDTTRSSFGFKLALAGKSVSAAEGNLMVNLDKTRCRIIEDSPTNVLR